MSGCPVQEGGWDSVAEAAAIPTSPRPIPSHGPPFLCPFPPTTCLPLPPKYPLLTDVAGAPASRLCEAQHQLVAQCSLLSWCSNRALRHVRDTHSTLVPPALSVLPSSRTTTVFFFFSPVGYSIVYGPPWIHASHSTSMKTKNSQKCSGKGLAN